MISNLPKVFIIIFFLAFSDLALSETIHCRTINSGSKSYSVAGFRDTPVAKTCGHNNHRFSVNGASTGSPPRYLIMAGLSAIKRNMITSDLENDQNEHLVAAVLSANEVHGIPDDIKEKLSLSKNELISCFKDFYRIIKEDIKDYSKEFKTDEVFCAVVSSSKIALKTKGSEEEMIIYSDSSILSISVADSTGALNTLVIPEEYISNSCY